MKKLIALALMVVCVAGFSLGCGNKAKEPVKPADAATAPAGDAADAPAADTPATPAE